MSCLSDKAVKFVERLKKDERREYGPLFKALSKRFGKCDPPSTLRKQITTAVQGSDESLEEWADRIWALMLDGFPEADSAGTTDELSVGQGREICGTPKKRREEGIRALI